MSITFILTAADASFFSAAAGAKINSFKSTSGMMVFNTFKL